MDTVILTGATGFLGSRITELFLKNGDTVIAPIRLSSSLNRIKHLKNDPRFILPSPETPISELLSKYKVDAIIHTATCYGREGEPWSEIMETNLLTPLRLLFEAAHAGVPCFINADTFFKENIRFEGNEAYYVKTKKDFLNIGQYWTKGSPIKFFNLRIEQMYGPGDNPRKFIPTIIKKLQVETDIDLTLGEQRRDLVYVTDIARAFVLACQHRTKLNAFEEFGLGSGSSKSIKELVSDLHSLIDSQAKLKFGHIPYRDNEIMDSFADTSNNDKIGWKPEMDWPTGAALTVKYYSSGGAMT